MHATVVVVGGGYGGTEAAKQLDDVAEVVLVDPKDVFVHNVAALRALVEPAWTDRIFLPYDRLLGRGRVIRDRAVRVEPGMVTLGSGDRIAADYIVLASGSAYPFPAKLDVDDAASAKAKLRATHDALAGAERVLLLGAGPVGLELAGEIKAAWPDKRVTILDPAGDILAGGFSGSFFEGFPEEFRPEVRRQLDTLGVELVLGTSLREQPPSEAGEAKTFTATTHSGRQLVTDIWFQCFGVAPATGYLAGDLARARQPDGYLEVTAELRLPGQQRVFAIGDIIATPEAKLAAAAGIHAGLVAGSIRTMLDGGEELAVYEPNPPGLILPLGPGGGATYAPGWESYLDAETVSRVKDQATGHAEVLLERSILDAEMTSQFKGADLMVDDFAKHLGFE